MSDVSSPIDNEPEDVQKKMDAKVSLIIEKMKAYDPLVAQVKDLGSSVDLLFSLLKDISAKHASVQGSISQKIDGLQRDQSDTHSVAQSLSQKVSSSEDSLKGLKGEVDSDRENVSSSLGRLSMLQDALQKQTLSKDQFSAHTQLMEKSLSSIQQDLMSLRGEIESLKSTMAQHISLIHNVQESHQSLQKSFKESADLHTDKFSDLHQSLEILSQNMGSVIQKGHLSLQDSVKSAEGSIQGLFSDLYSLKDILGKKLENMDLDVSNAVSRSFNTDAQLKIMEKKLEKLSLQISKYELPK